MELPSSSPYYLIPDKNTGKILTDESGVPITNRTVRHALFELFTEERPEIEMLMVGDQQVLKKPNWLENWLSNVLTPRQYEYHLFSPVEEKTIFEKKPIHGLRDFFQPHSVVLDLGCGSGYVTYKLAKLFPQITFIGADHELTYKVTTKPEWQAPNLRYISIDWERMGLASNSIDRVIIANSLIYHAPYSEAANAELDRISHFQTLIRGNFPPTLPRKGIDWAKQQAARGWKVWVNVQKHSLVAEKVG